MRDKIRAAMLKDRRRAEKAYAAAFRELEAERMAEENGMKKRRAHILQEASRVCYVEARIFRQRLQLGVREWGGVDCMQGYRDAIDDGRGFAADARAILWELI